MHDSVFRKGRACRDEFWLRPWVIGVVLAALVIRFAYYKYFASHLPLSGDETFYFDKAHAISDWVRNIFSYSSSTSTTVEHIDLVERGWFLPGMCLVLSIPMIFAQVINGATPEQFDVASLRLFIGAVNFACLLLITHSVLKSFGSRAANVFLALAAFFPAYIAFSFSFWGEVLASNILVAYLILLSRLFVEPRCKFHKLAILAGFWLALLVYIRPNLVFMIPLTGILFTWSEIKRAGKVSIAATAKAAGFVFVLSLTFLLLIAPWSYAVSKKHGGVYLTTTSIELAVVISYAEGETRTTLFSRNSTIIGNLWCRLYETYSQEAKNTGRSYSEVSKGYRDRVLGEMELTDYTTAVRASLKDMFFRENQFLQRFSSLLQNGGSELESNSIISIFTLLSEINSLLWYIVLSISATIMIIPWEITAKTLGYSLLFRTAFLALSIQPFLVGTSGRYYAGMILPCLLGIGCLAQCVAEVQRHKLKRPFALELLAVAKPESLMIPLITIISLVGVLALR